MRKLLILPALALAACSNANSADGLWLLDIAATREAQGYKDNLSADPNTEMALNFLAQTESELHIQDGKFRYLGADCEISRVGEQDGAACVDRNGRRSSRTIKLKEAKLWLASNSGYPEVFIKVK